MVDRIRELLAWQQLSPTQFADRIGAGRPVVSHILSERNKPSLEVVQRIIAAFPAVSLPWLLSGTGPMLAANPENLAAVAPTPASAAAAASPTALKEASAPAAATAGTATVAPQTAATRRVDLPPRPQARPNRFVASAAPATTGAPAAAVAETPTAPVAAALVAASAAGSPVTQAASAELLPLLAAAKAIRRIVIFYQDGSFADYSPES